jgi:ankyrin repeat protein
MSNRICATILVLCAVKPVYPAQPASPANPTIFQAIRANDLALVKRQIADVNVKGERNATPLIYAAAFGSLDAMRMLIDAGADVNARNAFDATALLWCASDLAKVRLLVEKGADVNVKSKQGKTPLLVAADHSGAEPIVRLLLAKGADAKAVDGFMNTSLSVAAQADDTASVRLLIEKGVDVNARNRAGDTALMYAAANGNLEAVRLLLKAGADVNAVSEAGGPKVKAGTLALGKFTALLLAATYGSPEMLKTLLDARADVNAKDMRGMTPLMMAVSSESQRPEVVRLLLARGADTKATSLAGETAAEWAAKFGRPAVMNLLKDTGAKPAATADGGSMLAAEVSSAGLSKSVEKSLGLLLTANPSFFREGGCAGCHHQQLTAVAVSKARNRAVPIDEAAVAEQLKIIKSEWISQPDLLLQRIDPPAGTAITGFSMFALAAMNYAPDAITDAMVSNVAAQQKANGSWSAGGIARSPMGDGPIGVTARDILALRTFAFPSRKAEFDQRIERARKWLAAETPRYNEDRTFQLLGLKWAGADASVLRKLAKELLAEQRPDGGWSQNQYLFSDAYATGQTLYALNQAAGVSASEKAYQRGISYLLKTQLADGSWHVKSRAVKFQPYFQSGFPHDHDQWISSAAAAWSSAAIALGLPERAGTVAASR